MLNVVMHATMVDVNDRMQIKSEDRIDKNKKIDTPINEQNTTYIKLIYTLSLRIGYISQLYKTLFVDFSLGALIFEDRAKTEAVKAVGNPRRILRTS